MCDFPPGKLTPLELRSGRIGTKEIPKTGQVKEKKYQTSGKRKRTRVEEAIQETEARFHLAFEEVCYFLLSGSVVDPATNTVMGNCPAWMLLALSFLSIISTRIPSFYIGQLRSFTI